MAKITKIKKSDGPTILIKKNNIKKYDSKEEIEKAKKAN